MKAAILLMSLGGSREGWTLNRILSPRCNLKKRSAVHCHRAHEEIPVEEQVPHFAARLRDQQATMASAAGVSASPLRSLAHDRRNRIIRTDRGALQCTAEDVRKSGAPLHRPPNVPWAPVVACRSKSRSGSAQRQCQTTEPSLSPASHFRVKLGEKPPRGGQLSTLVANGGGWKPYQPGPSAPACGG